MSDETTTQNGNGIEIKKQKIELERNKWKGRRKMAWVSLISMTIITYLILFTNLCPPDRLTIVTEVITWYYFASASIIGAYMGVTAWAHIKGK